MTRDALTAVTHNAARTPPHANSIFGVPASATSLETSAGRQFDFLSSPERRQSSTPVKLIFRVPTSAVQPATWFLEFRGWRALSIWAAPHQHGACEYRTIVRSGTLTSNTSKNR